MPMASKYSFKFYIPSYQTPPKGHSDRFLFFKDSILQQVGLMVFVTLRPGVNFTKFESDWENGKPKMNYG